MHSLPYHHRFFRYLLFSLILGPGAILSLRAESPFSYANTFATMGQPQTDWRDAWACDFDWELCNSALRNEKGGGAYELLKAAPFGRRVQIETTLTINRPVGQGWKVAGIAIYLDKGNFWQLALVDSWDSKNRYAELCEMRNGVWQANRDLQVLASAESSSFKWEYNQAYRLSLKMQANEIHGAVYDSSGNRLWQTGYQLTEKAVNQGIPGMRDLGFSIAIRDFKATVAETTAGPAKAKLPPYDRMVPAKVTGKKTGFFHVEKIDSRWWVIDPMGQGFYIIATEYVDNRRWFCPALGYAPYERNVAKKYPSTNVWLETALKRLKDWGFNSLGVGCADIVLHKGLPDTIFLNIGLDFCRLGEPYRITFVGESPGTYFPNVFHPRFEEFSIYKAAAYASRRNDPWLLGYFLDNELAWWGKLEFNFEGCSGLFDVCMDKPADHSAKQALVDWLRSRYGTVEKLNNEWGCSLTSFAQLYEKRALTGSKDVAVTAAKANFARLVAERYFAITTSAIRKVDPNHMILGCRFSGWSSQCYQAAWKACGQYCDIVSANIYENVDLNSGRVFSEVKGKRLPMDKILQQVSAQACGKPLWITEWSFRSYESSAPNTYGSGQIFDTQAEKAVAFTAFQQMLFSLPCAVGSSYFQWHDQPSLGMVESASAENSNYGLVNLNDEPYEPLTRAAAKINRRMEDIRLGRTAELSVNAEKNGDFRIANSGRKSTACLVRLWTDGQFEEKNITLEAGTHQIVAPSLELKGTGGHFLQCQVEAADDAFELDRNDNSAGQVVFTPAEKQIAMPENARFLAAAAVFNPTDQNMPAPYLTLKQADLPFKLEASENKNRLVAIMASPDGKMEFLPTQVDFFDDGAELTIRVPELAPHGVRTLFLCQQNRPGKASANAAFNLSQTPENFALDSGRLKVSRRNGSENLFDRVELDGKELGQFSLLIHEALPQETWVGPDKLDSIRSISGPLRLTLDVVMTRENNSSKAMTKLDIDGRREKSQQASARFSIGVRLTFYPGENWFAARTLWVKNIDTRPWELRSYFHYAPSNLGGSTKGDIPYQTGHWEDSEAGLCYGVVDPSRTFTLLFFNDRDGGQHPDARRAVNQVLQPGEKWQVPQPCLYIVGVNTPRDGKWKPIQTGIIARDEIGYKIVARP